MALSSPFIPRFEAEPLDELSQNVIVDDSKHRWALIPDSEGGMHLVDLNPLEVAVESFYVPATDIAFLLFTRQNPTIAQRITFDLASLQNSNFNAAHQTRFTMHGWQGSIASAVNVRVAEAYFQHGDYNVNLSTAREALIDSL